ncbi:MAG TPA: alkaline phosphatase PhoX, partial [Anaerolineae bacterium]|nr:alkaline phosphatase PhoX [Anaerolineae bacterium]
MKKLKIFGLFVVLLVVGGLSHHLPMVRGNTPTPYGGSTATGEVVTSGKTAAGPYFVVNESSDRALPLLTVGDAMPLLQSHFPYQDGSGETMPPSGSLNWVWPEGMVQADGVYTYTLPGILDGLGHVTISNTHFVFVNHELSYNYTTDYTGYDLSGNRTELPTDDGAVVSGRLHGGRVSLLAFDEAWGIIGGRNLVERVEVPSTLGTKALQDDGYTGYVYGTYLFDPVSGDYLLDGIGVTPGSEAFLGTASPVAGANWEALLDGTDGVADGEIGAFGAVLKTTIYANTSRFCSAYLVIDQFRLGNGQIMPALFNGEEIGNGIGYVHWANGTSWPLLGLGTSAMEQVYVPSQFSQETSSSGLPEGETVIIVMDDRDDGEIYMYRGEQTVDDLTGLVDLGERLYVLRVRTADDTGWYTYEQMPENVPLVAEWVLVAGEPVNNHYDTTDVDGDGNVAELIPTSASGINTLNTAALQSWVNSSDRSTNFRRPEDIHEDPNNPNHFYLATTGSTTVPPGETTPDNPYGKLYRFILDETALRAATAGQGTIPAGTIELLLEGGLEHGISYDNLVVDSDGRVLINEDKAGYGGGILSLEERQAGVAVYDIALNETAVGTDTVTFLGFNNVGPIEPGHATNYGVWESSGIIQISDNYRGTGENGYLLTVQAHTIRDQYGVGENVGDGGYNAYGTGDYYFYEGNLIEGGQ